MNNTLKSPSKERPPNKIKMAECTFFEKTVYCTTMQMVLNERTPKNAGVSSFRFFIYLRGPCALKNRNDDPPAFSDVHSFASICKAVQCTIFSEKVHFVICMFFLIFIRDEGPLNKYRKDDPPAFLAFFHLEPFVTPAMHRFMGKRNLPTPCHFFTL